MFSKQDVTVYLTYVKILKSTKFLTSHFRNHFRNTLKMASGMCSQKFSRLYHFNIC